MAAFLPAVSRAVLQQSARSLSTGASLGSSRVAVVLSGCGVFDGSELHEASAVLMHLSRHGAEVTMFAPDKDQMHVINHCVGSPLPGKTRNVMVESARIARGNITSLSTLNTAEFDAVVFPGGFGVAKNLSTFATEGEAMSVEYEVERVLKEFRASNKPMGFCCIAPVLAARIFPQVEVTVGMNEEEGGRWPYAGTAAQVQAMGAKHVNKEVTETHVDSAHRVVTTPAFMCNAPLHQVFDGIGNMIATLIKMAES